MNSWEYCEISYYESESFVSGGNLIVYGKEDRNYVDYADLRNEIAKLGQERWEMVSVVSDSRGRTVFYFKRKIEE